MAKKLAGYKKKTYLCTRNNKEGTYSGCSAAR